MNVAILPFFASFALFAVEGLDQRLGSVQTVVTLTRIQ